MPFGLAQLDPDGDYYILLTEDMDTGMGRSG